MPKQIELISFDINYKMKGNHTAVEDELMGTTSSTILMEDSSKSQKSSNGTGRKIRHRREKKYQEEIINKDVKVHPRENTILNFDCEEVKEQKMQPDEQKMQPDEQIDFNPPQPIVRPKPTSRSQDEIFNKSTSLIRFNLSEVALDVDFQREIQEKQEQIHYDESEDEQQEEAEGRYKTLGEMVLAPICRRKMVSCVFKTQFSRWTLTKTFQLYLSIQKKLILKVQKFGLSIGDSKFNVFTLVNGNKNLIATITSNFTRTQYRINLLDQTKQQNIEIGYLQFLSNWFGMGQQSIKLILPIKNKKISKMYRFSDLKVAYEKCQFQRVQVITNKLAQKNKKGELILDYKTQNLMRSSNNTILETDSNQVCLTFAKTQENIYMINAMNPLSLLQVCFFGVSNIDKQVFSY